MFFVSDSFYLIGNGYKICKCEVNLKMESGLNIFENPFDK